MKILFVSDAESIHTIRWVNALVQKGHDVHLAYCRNHFSNECKSIHPSVVMHRLPFASPLGYYLNASALKRLYRKIKPDVVNVHYASGYGTLACRSKIPYILSVWGSDVYEFPYKRKSNFRRILKNLNGASDLVSTSHIMANQVRKLLGDDTKGIGVTPFGVDVDLFAPNCKKVISSDGTVLIGTVKSLSPLYGITDAVRAFSQVLQKVPPTLREKLRYEIYGSGNQKEEIEALIVSLGLEKSVFLKGFVPNAELPKIINRFRIFLTTSLMESFGVAAVEAMACGVPCVTSDADGFREVMVDGETGYIAKRGNIDDIADKICALLSASETDFERMSKNCIRRVHEHYVFEKNVDKMLEIYHDGRI